MDRYWKFYYDYKVDGLIKKRLLDDPDLALGLVKFNKSFIRHRLLKDLDILALRNGRIGWWLARQSDVNGWAETREAQDIEVLSLYGGLIAVELARCSKKNGWAKTPAAHDFKVLKLANGKVIYWLVKFSKLNGWGKIDVAKNKKFLKSSNKEVKELFGNYKLGDIDVENILYS